MDVSSEDDDGGFRIAVVLWVTPRCAEHGLRQRQRGDKDVQPTSSPEAIAAMIGALVLFFYGGKKANGKPRPVIT